jgi:uncharacterized integral membrane protein
MLRLILTMLTTVAFVAFALSNTQRVAFSFVLGETEVRLIFLLVLSFVVGFLAVLLHTALKDAKRRAEHQKMRAAMTRAALLDDE